MLSGDRVSRTHARVYVGESGSFWVSDLGSRHGTSLNDELLRNEARPLKSGDTISIGAESLRFISGDDTRLASREAPLLDHRAVRLEGDRLTIGRDRGNDLVLADPNVSRFHAEVVRRAGVVELVDLGSRNGTRLDGRPVRRAELPAGTEIRIGPYALTFDGDGLLARDEHGALRLDTQELEVEIKKKRILAPTTIAIEPGDFVVIIGESGAGKSTLIKTLAGVSPPTRGAITISGEPLAARLTDIGYVPQDDIVHGHLSVREALRYAARLRLPQDTSTDEIEAAVERVIGELALAEHADTRIDSLSGGQRKRTGVAVELLGRPSLLFLDEPTTGLDPGLETRMMELLRELANQSRAVTVVTHATKNLRLCDKIAVMGRGGELTYFGPPEEALAFFGVEDFDSIYRALDERPAAQWRSRFESDPSRQAARTPAPGADGRAALGPSVQRPARRRPRVFPQALVLTRRYAQLVARDRRNLALLIGQVPVLALLNVGLFKSGLFDRPGGRPFDATQLLFLFAIATVWLGSIDAAREIVKEKGVLARERAIGVRLSAYLGSKALVLFALVAVQSLLFGAIMMAGHPLDAPASTYAAVLGLLVMTGFAAVAMGLLVSAAASTQDQAMSMNPLALIPQLLFAGAIISVAQMVEPIKTFSGVMFAQWSFAGIGTAVDMNGRIAEDPHTAGSDRFGPDFFDVQEPAAFLILLGFTALFLAGTFALLRTRARR
jgi:ABC-type multidrug transport system ATPase subunit